MPEDVLNADTASDREVEDALGLGDDDQQAAETDEASEPTVEEQLAEMRREVARLKREAAAARVASKQQEKVVPVEDGKALTQADLDAAVERGKQDARLEAGIELARARVEAALTGIVPDAEMADFIEDLNLARLVGDDGRPDSDAISALKSRQSKLVGKRPAANVGHGRTGGSSKPRSMGDQFAAALEAAGF